MHLWATIGLGVAVMVLAWRLRHQRNRLRRLRDDYDAWTGELLQLARKHREQGINLDSLQGRFDGFSTRMDAIEHSLTQRELPPPPPDPTPWMGAFAPTDESAAMIETRLREAEDHSLSATVRSPVPSSSVRSSRSGARSVRGAWTPGASRSGRR